MNETSDPVFIETEQFAFEAPSGYVIEILDEQAELVGPNQELLVVSSYSVGEFESESVKDEFLSNVCQAMTEAADEPDLLITGKLKSEASPNGFNVWSILTEATDQSHFFDQYAVVHETTSVLVTIEGDFEDRSASAIIEEAVYSIEFK